MEQDFLVDFLTQESVGSTYSHFSYQVCYLSEMRCLADWKVAWLFRIKEFHLGAEGESGRLLKPGDKEILWIGRRDLSALPTSDNHMDIALNFGKLG